MTADRDVPLPPFDAWDIVDESVAESAAGDGALAITSKPTRYLYLALSPPMRFARGWYALDYAFEGIDGGFSLGILSGDGRTWLATQEHRHKGGHEFQLRFGGGNSGRIVISGCNYPDEAVTRMRLASLRLSVRPGWLPWLREGFYLWRARRKPTRYFMLRTRCLQAIGRLSRAVFRLAAPWRGRRRRYVVVDSAPAGYACRSIIGLMDGDHGHVVTANAGDDTLSVIAVGRGRLGAVSTVAFPRRSTPLHLAALPEPGDRSFLVCLFNFDESGAVRDRSCLARIDDVAGAVAAGRIDPVEAAANIVFERPGHWGFRGCCAVRDGAGALRIAAVDRDRSALHLVDFGDGRHSDHRIVDLGGGSEPVGICAVPETGLFLIGLRSRNELIVAGPGADGAPAVTQRCTLNGPSRSSVVVGRFLAPDRRHVAIALWGGDPQDMNGVRTGELAVAPLSDDGVVGAFDYVAAGIHPTDVVAGDFDGDGLDEIAVLNFGTGLNPDERTRTGGVQIFKGAGGRLAPVAHVALPNPRIGAAVDIDGDGVAELLVSLFYESRIAVVKCV